MYAGKGSGTWSSRLSWRHPYGSHFAGIGRVEKSASTQNWNFGNELLSGIWKASFADGAI
jgi:hypothetical protein